MDTGTVEILARGVCVRDGRLLLCHTAGADNTYLPGGHVEFGEPARESLAREMVEETGLTARVGRFLGAAEHRFVQKGEPHAEINLIFEMEVEGVEADRPVSAREQHLDFRWAQLDRLDEARLEPATLRQRLPVWLSEPCTGADRWAAFHNSC